MAMLKKRKMILALISKIPMLLGRKSGKYETQMNQMMDEIKFLYGQLGLYDKIMDHMMEVGI